MTKDDIAIVGLSYRFPAEVEDEFQFWDILENRRSMMSEWPKHRSNVDAFYDANLNPSNKLGSRGAHFLSQDPAIFDAPFFSITRNEAIAMDPQQRYALEASYRAFENAGLPLESLRGSRTAVFSSSMLDDYARLFAKDPDDMPRMAVTGCASSAAANRLSWYFDLLGPSVHVDTACSSSLVAIDLACQSIHNSGATAALVTGTNLILGPESSILLSNQNFLSPDSLCYSFDYRANGYSRGEGVVAVVLKPVSAAISNGDMIRAVIRSTGSNQDGRTSHLTQPNVNSQEALIREVYQKAGLGLEQTRYVEAHGTGTPVGDPVELEAIGRIPTGRIPWPQDGVRRISVNSFGFGVLTDEASHAMTQAAGFIQNSHEDSHIPLSPTATNETCLRLEENPQSVRTTGLSTNGAGHQFEGSRSGAASLKSTVDPVSLTRLLVWTAPNKKALKRVTEGYNIYLQSKLVSNPKIIDELVYTLAKRRSHMPWRTFAVVDARKYKQEDCLSPAIAVRASNEAGLAWVFTGQGAQYERMGYELLQYQTFSKTIKNIDSIYQNLGCTWSIFDEIKCGKNIDKPQYSQPLSTALQIALTDLLFSFGICPMAVIGHSSGEIAAAYAVGSLSLKSACKVSYFRGQLAGKLQALGLRRGAMLSANLRASQVPDYLSKFKPSIQGSVHVACINSAYNCTLSGDEAAINIVMKQLYRDGTFCQILKTGVAYHSPAMEELTLDYLRLMGPLESWMPRKNIDSVMISSVTAEAISASSLVDPNYWVENMVSPVKFSDAMSCLLSKPASLQSGIRLVSDIAEIGPHSALRRPIQDNLDQTRQVQYSSVLYRFKPAHEALLEFLGNLFCRGHQVSIPIGYEQTPPTGIAPLVDCPQYPFDRSERYWAESRLSRDYRLREAGGELLGWRFHDWNPLEPRWRNFLSAEDSPWIGDHVVSGAVVFPGAGMILMALEAVNQMSHSERIVSGFYIKSAHFSEAIMLSESSTQKTETMVHLIPTMNQYEKEALWSNVKIFSFYNDRWHKCFQAMIQIQYNDTAQQVDNGLERRLANLKISDEMKLALQDCTKPVERDAFYKYCSDHGINYGKSFRLLDQIRWDGHETAVADVDVSGDHHHTSSIVHPVILDTAFQLMIAPGSKGLLDHTATNVPYRLSDAWFSASGWKPPNTTSLRYLTKVEDEARGFRGEIQVVSDNGSPLCLIKKLRMRVVAERKPDQHAADCLLHRVEWAPALGLLNEPGLKYACDAQTYMTDQTAMQKYRINLDSVLDMVIHRTHAQLSEQDRQNVPGFLQGYLRWIDHYVHHTPAATALEKLSDESLELQLRNVEELRPAWRLIPVVARNLISILRGDIDPLQIAFDTKLAEIFYADFFDMMCDHRLRSLMHLISHENPCSRFLEVGAGTGGVTSRLLSILKQLEKSSGGVRFSQYTYTDISPVFFEDARVKFSEFGDRMIYKAFDIDQPAGDQGIDTDAKYDIIIAGSVLHATRDLTVTIQNLRQLLSPGGYLIILEITKNLDIAMNFTFGVLPGWWSFRDEWRVLSPTVDEPIWDELLKQNGFSGIDVSIRDFEDESCHLASIMLSKAIELCSDISSNGEALLIINPQSTGQVDLATHVQHRLHSLYNYKVDVTSIQKTADRNLDAHTIVICLVEIEAPLLACLSEESFQSVNDLVTRTKKLLWITSTDLCSPNYSFYGFIQGFLRAISTESPEKHIVQLAIESSRVTTEVATEYIIQVFKAAFHMNCSESEYIVRDGLIATGRLVEDVSTDERMRSLTYPRARTEPLHTGPPTKLVIGARGDLETLRFIEDDEFRLALAPSEIEVELKAWGLSFRDLFFALGRLKGDEWGLGSDCAGIVTRVGASCKSTIQPGDRVCLAHFGSMRTLLQTPPTLITKIPDSMSFEEAASILTPGITAYYALVKVARLQKNDKILIHSAAGSTGQMAVWIAKMIGVEVFATVGFDDKKQLLVEQFGIPETHILYSRNSTFKQGIMRMTNGYGVDVVLNSLSGDGLIASWECIAPGGRFLEIGKADIGANSSLPMAQFAKNVTFSGIDLAQIATSNKQLLVKLQQETLDLLTKGAIRSPTPLNLFSASNIEDAFRLMQSGRNTGRIIVSPRPSDVVQKYSAQKSNWRLSEHRSYLVAGGWGGLGREILKWLVEKGAMYLIVPSRSGGSSKEASEVMTELLARGVTIVAPTCDASSTESLSNALKECSKMPPISGCINAAMVLQDAIFSNMKFEQWNLTIRSKAYTSWNLHKLLPQSLDFFVQLSSLSGITGGIAQSNYAAGCTFQDALARYRTSCGAKAVSLDLGWMQDIGIIAENEAYKRQRENAADMRQIQTAEFLSILDVFCNPGLPVLPVAECQVLIGLMLPTHRLTEGLAPVPTMQKPLYAGFSQFKSGSLLPNQSAPDQENSTLLFKQASSTEERITVVIAALATKLGRALSISTDDVDSSKPLSSYGVDSLMAVELRNYIGKTFQAEVAVFEITGGTAIQSIGRLVVDRSLA
ncbi:hypothetical protein JX266_009821 [Neoarthrinium moseri]|nr:hypothetical protein JX266_009821 [Neoarthrinium moseri]